MPPPRLSMATFLRRLQIRTSSSPVRDVRAWKRPVTMFATCALLGHLTVSYIGSINRTTGISMMPTIPGSGSPRVLLSALHRRGRNIKVGDLIIFAHPITQGVRGCKRVIGMPGDFVSVISPGRTDDDLYKSDNEGDWANVKEELIQVPEGHCWVAGDNLEWSRDSRLFGPIPLALVKGKIMAVVWPLADAKWVGADKDVVQPQEGEHKWVRGT